jgi:hypothetical protein
VKVTHITNYLRSKDDDRILPAAHTDKVITFHGDIGDIVSLYALDEPATGGESLLASTWRLYNEIAKTRPDLIRALAENWPMPMYVYAPAGALEETYSLLFQWNGLLSSTALTVLSAAQWSRPREDHCSVLATPIFRDQYRNFLLALPLMIG